ncbi:hypothetical protein BLNAU_17239 [Blattamonas nauphoetae]|uniref:Protein kinase domain-containing protein n=1 Tax=Blattamonas nauphoetae TaxID=2049346 RepID=A0ABQ9X8W3_9EUKA|nr:hypothetical protein BLNAU_17239 [Blattamonas nauphoetae]
MRSHIFLTVPLIVSLFHLTFHADVLPEGNLLPLKPILEELTNARTSNTAHRNDPIILHGQYHLLEYVIRSVNISIVGAHSSSITSKRAEDNQDISNTEPSSMLIVANSTVELSSLRLICHGDHSSVATIRQSSLSVSNCKIYPASCSSPFLSTWTCADVSMLTVVNTKVTWKQHPTSLPLFGSMPNNHKSLVTESSASSILGRDAGQATGVLSIIGSGLSFSNTALPLATGPLFDFGLNENNTQQSLLAASLSLTTSLMTNVTSRRHFIPDTLRFPFASQKLISSSISECTNHLYGSGCLDFYFGTSFCCQNSSFSKCETDDLPTEGPPKMYLQHQTTPFDQTLSPTLTQFDTCTFRDMNAYRGGAISSFKVGASLSVTKCSFTRCTCGFTGGSVYYNSLSTTESVAVSHCSFVSGGSATHGGGMQFSCCQQGSVTDCVFHTLYATKGGHRFELSFPEMCTDRCEDGDSGFDAFFSLKARTLATGSYKASVKGKSDFWMVVDFEGSPSGGNIFSTKAGVKLQGEDAVLDFETTYELDEVVEVSTGETLVIDPPRLFFTTPSRPSLDSVDAITIKLVGEKLFTNPYTLTVSDGSSTSTVTAVFDADGVNGETTAVLYSMDESKTIQLTFGKTYTITGITCPGLNHPAFTPNLPIVVPTEPARVEKVVSAALNDAQTTVEVTFQARALPSTISTITVTGQDPSVVVSIKRFSDTSFSALFNVAETASPTSLVFSETYTIASVSNGTDLLLNDDISFTVPSNARLTDIGTAFSNNVSTGLKVELTVAGSIHNSKYKLTLTDDIEVEVECSSSTLKCTSTSPVRIGWATGLQYGTEHTVSAMQATGVSSQRVDLVKKSFKTGTKPTQPVFHVDESGDLSDFCGDDGDECQTMDEVWRIVKGIGFPRPTIHITDSTTLDLPIVVSEGMHVMVTNGSSTEPKLHVASNDLSGGQFGMIVVNTAFIELRNVDVHFLSVSRSFVLIHGTNSELVFRDGLFAGPASGVTMNEDSDGVCSWSSGAIQLINSKTDIAYTRLFQLSQGAINMKSGSLDIRTSSFDSNSASSSSFPSSRRNIHCSDRGTITIGSLSGGDGHQGSSLWASMEDCVMKGDAGQPDSPLFVPQLDKERSKSVVDADTQQYKVTLVGSRLIPCGLFLEVFEFTPESNADGKSVEFELNHTSSETEVSLVIEQEEIAALDQKHELRCRLKFGLNPQTTDSFIFSAAHIDDPEPPEPEPEKPKFSQTPLGKALSWIVPVVAGVLLLLIVIVVLLVWRRKRQQKQEDKTELTEVQEDEECMAKADGPDVVVDETRNIIAVNKHQVDTTNNLSTFSLPSTGNEGIVEVLFLNDSDQKEIVETKFITSKETLFHRLHEAQNPKPIEAEKIQKALTEQLLRVMQKMPTAQVLQNLNPHWVILGDGAEVHFKLVDDQAQNQSLCNKMNNPNGGDSQRWNPPEESKQKNESEQKSTINKEASLVFRLGLLLWEIETGQVPYREHDGLNAHRQIVLGVGLKMTAIENEALRELIEDCMQLEPKNRPTLQKVKDRLFKCFSPSMSDATLGQQTNKAESKQ